MVFCHMPLHLHQILNSPWDWNIAFCTMCFLLHHLSSIPLIHQHLGPQEILFPLVGLNNGGNEGEPLVTSSSNILMGGAALAC